MSETKELKRKPSLNDKLFNAICTNELNTDELVKILRIILESESKDEVYDNVSTLRYEEKKGVRVNCSNMHNLNMVIELLTENDPSDIDLFSLYCILNNSDEGNDEILNWVRNFYSEKPQDLIEIILLCFRYIENFNNPEIIKQCETNIYHAIWVFFKVEDDDLLEYAIRQGVDNLALHREYHPLLKEYENILTNTTRTRKFNDIARSAFS